ncbi:AI-2E family transporter [Bradyrhizobium canariense]|uniref:Predicted PurR-regulated permease PerM n=1 Tax=Bradyrhizobium canariense TaxID=255045 RepID=A0A1H1ZWB8_9BRAD|nr:AI-2E family transporter [Bradyrhizobium canariense]SDT37692.1 Predicted PurR-regulated permease PerM [Bradyrhizobium canariense]
MAVAALIIAALYFGREIFVPVALAVLLSFVLAPFVMRLHSWRVPRTLAVLVVVFVGFSIIFSLGGLMVSQASRLARELPRYQQTLSDKIESLRGLMGGSGTLEQASTVLKELGTQLQHPDAADQPNNGLLRQPSNNPAPIPVEVKQPDPGALTTLVAIIEPLLSPLTTTGIVVIFVVFILLQREDLRNRVVRLAGSGDIQRTTAALDDAGQRLSKLFLTQIAFNAVFGLAIGIGLELIGVPSAPLWGLIAMILRFVPYIGALISAVFPLILSAAVGSGWEMLVLTAALFVVLELLAGQVLEPLIFGHSTGLSPVAIILSASFWTWLWGPVGLVLATPLTVCLVVVGRHVDRLKFLDIMLGDRPPLTPSQLVYQRMLAGDPIEAAEQAHEHLKNASLEDYYDTILLKGLRLAETDNRLGHLNEERLDRIVATVGELVSDLETHNDAEVADAAPADVDSNLGALVAIERAGDRPILIPEQWQSPRSVLCVPGASKIDEAAALVVAQILRRRGFGAASEKADALSMSKFFSLDLTGTLLVCVCYVDRPSGARIQYAVRRLTKKNGSVKVLLALLGADGITPAESPAGTLVAQGSFEVVLETLLQLVSEQSATTSDPENVVVAQ